MSAANPASYKDLATRTLGRAAFGHIEAFLTTQRHRLPLFIPIALGMGILAWFELGNSGLWQWAALASIMLALGAFSPAGSYLRRILIAAALLLALGFSLISVRSAIIAPDTLERPWVGRIYARVHQIEDRVALGKQRLLLETEGAQGLPLLVRVSRPIDSEGPDLYVGDVIALKLRLMPPSGPAFPGAYDFSQRAFFDGLGASGTALGAIRLVQRPEGGGGHSFRIQLARHVRDNVAGDAGAIASTLVTGDRSAISEVAAENMRRSGMAHLLSISGLHVTSVVGAVFLIILRVLAAFPPLALRSNLPLIGAVGGALAAIGYTMLTGAAVPTIRACIAALLILAALAMGRDPISLRLVAVGATLVLLFLPESLVGPSFQLSFAAVTAIIALYDSGPMRNLRDRRAETIGGRLLRGLLYLFLTGLAVEVTLAPIALYHFHETGLYGALANIAAIPLTTFVVMPLLAGALIADLAGLGAPLWWLAGKSLDLLLGIASTAAHAPGAHVVTPAMSGGAFALYAAGLILLFLLTGRARLIGLPVALLGLLAMLWPSPPDLLIDGSGRHILVRAEAGTYYSVREGGGDFIRDLIAEQTGAVLPPKAIDTWPRSDCSPDACLVEMSRSDRKAISLLITRSSKWLDYERLIATCRNVDFAISDRSLPKACTPRKLRIDRYLLSKTGGLAIDFDRNHVESVAQHQAHLPWSRLSADHVSLVEPTD